MKIFEVFHYDYDTQILLYATWVTTLMQRFAEATQRYFAVAKAPLFVSLATVGRDGM